MAEGIVKDTGDIYSSIFNHKPALEREVSFFVKEFEEKRKDREIDHLFKILERVTELKDTEIPRAASLADIHLPKLSAELEVAVSISDKLIQRTSSTADEKYAKKLEIGRAERAKEWDAFVHEMTTRCIRIDGNYKAKEDEVRKLYLQAEEKLLK
jgi:hypothetical protein